MLFCFAKFIWKLKLYNECNLEQLRAKITVVLKLNRLSMFLYTISDKINNLVYFVAFYSSECLWYLSTQQDLFLQMKIKCRNSILILSMAIVLLCHTYAWVNDTQNLDVLHKVNWNNYCFEFLCNLFILIHSNFRHLQFRK